MGVALTVTVAGILMLGGMLANNPRLQAAVECKIDALAEKDKRHYEVIERIYFLKKLLAFDTHWD